MAATPKYLKPSAYAELTGIKYRTVIKQFHNGTIDGYTDECTGSIYLLNPEYTKTQEQQQKTNQTRAILYARVSSPQNKQSLDGQIQRLEQYAAAKGYTITKEIKETASGLNDHRPKLTKILQNPDWDVLLVEHKDRLTRFGWNYFTTLLPMHGQRVEAINMTEQKDKELTEDLISIITSFCGRLYGIKRKEKTQRIINELANQTNTDTNAEQKAPETTDA